MTMKKLFIYLFIMTAGLLSATQVSAQKEIAPEVIKLQKGEIESTGTLLCRGFDSFSASNGQRMVPAIRPLTTI
jgi:hypothetical protein